MKSFPTLLFAAGRGTRMGALGDHLPKCLIPVAGQTLLDHALALTQTPEVAGRVVNLHYKAQMIMDHLADQDVAFSHEQDRALETGGGLRHALPLLDGNPVITVNTDAVWTTSTVIKDLSAAWEPHMDGMLAIVPKSHAFGHLGEGDFDLNAKGQISRGTDFIYTGVQMIRTDLLHTIAEDVFTLHALWNQFLAKGTLYGMVYNGSWCDVGQPQSIQLAEDMIGYQRV